jgi:hypothetical protein
MNVDHYVIEVMKRENLTREDILDIYDRAAIELMDVNVVAIDPNSKGFLIDGEPILLEEFFKLTDPFLCTAFPEHSIRAFARTVRELQNDAADYVKFSIRYHVRLHEEIDLR